MEAWLLAIDRKLPSASLASMTPYPVPPGAKLVFRPTRFTTDGFQMGDVCVVFGEDDPGQVIATTIPATGGPRSVRALGDYARLFPDPLPLEKPGGLAGA